MHVTDGTHLDADNVNWTEIPGVNPPAGLAPFMLAKLKRKVSSRTTRRSVGDGEAEQKEPQLSHAPSLDSKDSSGSEGVPNNDKRHHIHKMYKLFGRFSVQQNTGLEQEIDGGLERLPHDLPAIASESERTSMRSSHVGSSYQSQASLRRESFTGDTDFLCDFPRRMEGFPGVPTPIGTRSSNSSVDSELLSKHAEPGAGRQSAASGHSGAGPLQMAHKDCMMPPEESSSKSGNSSAHDFQAAHIRGSSFRSDGSGFDLSALVHPNQLELLFAQEAAELDGMHPTVSASSASLLSASQDGDPMAKLLEDCAGPIPPRLGHGVSQDSDPMVKFFADSSHMSSFLYELEEHADLTGTRPAGMGDAEEGYLESQHGHTPVGLMHEHAPAQSVFCPYPTPSSEPQLQGYDPSMSNVHAAALAPRNHCQMVDGSLQSYCPGQTLMPQYVNEHISTVPTGGASHSTVNGAMFNVPQPQLAQPLMVYQQMPMSLPTATAIPFGTPMVAGNPMYAYPGGVHMSNADAAPGPSALSGYGHGLQLATVTAVGGNASAAMVCGLQNPMGVPNPSTAAGMGNGARMDHTHRNIMGRKEWSPEEDRTILEAVDELGQKWRVVAQRLVGRSDDAVRNRWKRLNKERLSNVYDGTDSNTPDIGELYPDSSVSTSPVEISQRQESPLSDHGGATWGGGDFPQDTNGKGSMSSRAERLPWTPAEDTEIVRSVQQLGLKWQKIAARLPGSRTPHAVRNRFYRLKQLQQQPNHGDAPVVQHHSINQS